MQGAKVAGRRIEIVEGCSETGVYGRLINETRQLVEIDHVDAVVGGFGFSDGIVFRELARRYPTVPFLLVVSVVREATVHRPPPTSIASCPTSSRTRPGSQPTRTGRSAGGTPRSWPSTRPTAGAGPARFTREFCALGGTAQADLDDGTRLRAGQAAPEAGSGLGRRHGRALGVRVVREPGAVHPRLARAARRCPALAAARALDVSRPWTRRPLHRSGPTLHGVVARLARHPRPVLAVGRGLPQGLREAFPGPAAERREQPRRAAVLDCGGSAAAGAREDDGVSSATERAALRAALDSRPGSTPRGAACGSTATARPSYR